MKPTRTIASTYIPGGSTLALQEHNGQYYLRINGTTLMSTTAFASEQELARIACEKLKNTSARIFVGGLGFGFTLRQVLELVARAAQVEVAELVPEIVEWNRAYLQDVNGKSLDDPRVKLFQKDAFEVIKNSRQVGYDAILLDVDNSPDALVQSGNARLYSRAGIAAIRNALRPGGRVVFWSANPDAAFENLLRQVFRRTESVPARAYPSAKRPTHTILVADRE